MKNWSHETIRSQKFNGVERCRKACGDCGFRIRGMEVSWNWQKLGEPLAPDILAPSRRFPAFGKTHPIPVVSWKRAPSFFMASATATPGSTFPHKISSPRCPDPLRPLYISAASSSCSSSFRGIRASLMIAEPPLLEWGTARVDLED